MADDRQANEPSVWRYDGDLRRWARQLCRHEQDAEDVAQTALVKAAEHLDGFRGEASVRTWLHRIVANECRMLRRRTPPASLDVLLEGATPVALADPWCDPEEVVIDRARHAAALGAIGRLPERWRTVLLLSDGAGMSAAAVADATGSSVGAVRSVLHRARQSVRRDMAGS